MADTSFFPESSAVTGGLDHFARHQDEDDSHAGSALYATHLNRWADAIRRMQRFLVEITGPLGDDTTLDTAQKRWLAKSGKNVMPGRIFRTRTGTLETGSYFGCVVPCFVGASALQARISVPFRYHYNYTPTVVLDTNSVSINGGAPANTWVKTVQSYQDRFEVLFDCASRSQLASGSNGAFLVAFDWTAT